MREMTPGIRWVCKNTDELRQIAGQLLSEAGERRIFAFYGALGSGKTTFIKELCSVLGVKELVASPTFNIVNEYRSGSGQPVYHFDFYRIKSETEAFDLGYENYLYSGNYCFIEWPEKIASLLPQDITGVAIEAEGDDRIITLNV